ncbi:hypothetical protein H310_07575 [Aphanomyces invadans]|uniref:Uncharacterized protein n=1 Tax=Aphanomyces invadans TaxID=157072 RepID=A0A024U2P0_9STRA|nr:hypothetical protein H310_07575 [Aphanomyces invadans]ETW00172.1 hypothetical protein H310_07575 [Aphanomyces invadans]|eukprot:XP_008871197.1 hypothetical protein H310_07575 [Aphanomyces invadans]
MVEGTAAAIAFVAIVVSATTPTAPTCYHVDDPQSTLASTLWSLGNINSSEAFRGMSSVLPTSLSHCLGAVDATKFLALGMETLNQDVCARSMQWLQTPSPSTTRAPPSSDFSNGVMELLGSMDDVYFETICSPLDFIAPCLQYIVLPKVILVLTAEPCCANALVSTVALTGESLYSFLTKLLRHAVDIVCSTQSPGFHDQQSQTCGYTFLQSFLAPTGNEFLMAALYALNALQIPNDQGHLAVMGQPFTTTTRESVELFQAPMVPSTCAIPIDSMFSWVRSFPMLPSIVANVSLDRLFDDNKCVPGDEFLQIFTQAFPATFSNDTLPLIQVLVGRACFHFANGYAANVVGPPLQLFTNTLPVITGTNPTTSAVPTTTPSPTQGQMSKAQSLRASLVALAVLLGSECL